MNKRGEAITALVVIGLLALGAYTIMTVSSDSPTGLSTFETEAIGCTVITASDTLVNNATYASPGACINITGSNLVFDCLGNTIFYGSASAVAGIAVYNAQNVTIQNCILQQTTPSGAGAPGINLTNVNNSFIINNTIHLNTTGGSGPYALRVTGSNNNITGNTISSNSLTSQQSGIVLETGSNNNSIVSNVLNLNGTSSTQLVGAIQSLSASDSNFIDNNTINTLGTGINGIVFVTGTNLTITNNNITIYATSATGRNAIGLNTNSNNATVRNNRIFLTSIGSSPVGIRLFSTNDGSIFTNNSITLNGTGSSGRAFSFHISGTVSNFYIANNSFTIMNGGGSPTLMTSTITVNNGVIANNTFSQVGGPSTSAISGSTYNNVTFYNNTITNLSTGISVSGTFNLTAYENNVTITGSGEGIGLSASNSDIRNNTIISQSFGTPISISGTNGTIVDNDMIAFTIGSSGITDSGTNTFITNNTMTNGTLLTQGSGSSAFGNTLINSVLAAGGSSNSLHDNPMTFTTTDASSVYAIQISGSNNNVSNQSVIFSTSGNENRGLYISGSNNNISNINLTVNSGIPTYGIDIVSGASNNISDLIINTNGTAIKITDVSGQLFSNILFNNTSSWIDSQDTGTGADNNFTNATFVNTGIGQVVFPSFNITGNSNATRTTLNMSNNRIFLNTTVLPGMNQTATVSWFNATTSDIEVDFDDDGSFSPCGAVCTLVSFAAPNLVFNVSHFTTYQSGGAGGINLTITKTDSPDPVSAGAQLNYTITINVTNGTATNVVVNETYSGSVTFDSSSPSPSSGDNIFNLGNLTAPAIAQINITVNVSAGASGTLINSINVSYQNSTGDNLSAVVTESTTVTSSAPSGGGGGGGSGGSGGIICPPLCKYPENKNLPLCINNCPQQAEVTPPTIAQFPSTSPPQQSAPEVDAPIIVPEPEQVVEETVELVEETPAERSGFAKFFPWLVLLVLIALLIAIISRNRDGKSKTPIVKVVPAKAAKPSANDKDTQRILEDIRKSEERLKRLLGK
jgi:hypothetical protein